MEDHNVKIKYNGTEVDVKLKKLTWKEQNEATRVSLRKDNSVDFVTLQEQKLLKSISEAPFDLTIDALGALDATEGDKLFKAMMTLNGLTDEEQKNLKSPSMQEKQLVEK
jgi:hypothetical protein